VKSGNLLLIIVIVAVFYFLMIVPQRRQQKKRKDMMSQLGVGAQVVSAGGIHGEVTEVMDDAVMLEIAPDVEIKMERRSIVRVLEPGELEEADEDTDDDYDDDDALEQDDDNELEQDEDDESTEDEEPIDETEENDGTPRLS